MATVYPRVCGGSVGSAGFNIPIQGLSPRVRGKRVPPPKSIAYGRSIPACAGEAPRDFITPPAPGVYPRVCGGSGRRQSQSQPNHGLSPRVRGKPMRHVSLLMMSGSIPACAGEADGDLSQNIELQVYPRVCGGSL